MWLGIVGHEGAKFTPETERLARLEIRNLLGPQVTGVVSGACHLGGIDIWAIEEARSAGKETMEFPPQQQSWNTVNGVGGYKYRNMQIAQASDKVVCLVLKELPESYNGMRFRFCYHCKTDSHIKSGGCWTARYAGKLGKPFEIIEL